MDISLGARNEQLSPLLQARKQELNNVIEIIRLITDPGSALSAPMTSDQMAATLKNKLRATSTALLDNVVARLLPAINTFLGTAYVAADFQNGTVDVNALRDAMTATLSNHKLVVYMPFNVITIPATNSMDLGIGILGYADTTDWSLAGYGGLSAPYNTVAPVPSNAIFSDAIKVDVLSATEVVDVSGNKIIGYISAYNAVTKQITIVWGYKNSGGTFVATNFPTAFVGVAIQLVVPIKSNLAIMPIDALMPGKGAPAGSPINNVANVLSNNGLAIDTNLKAVLGVTSIQTASFQDATKHVTINPSGYSSAASGLLDLVVKVNTVFTTMRGLFDSLNSYLGKVDADAVPAYQTSELFGDVRDVIRQGLPVRAAIEALNKAFYRGNIITVAKVGGYYNTISAALAAIGSGTFGVPTSGNPFVINVAPGEYTENIVMQDDVYVCGSETNATIVNGTVTLGNRPSTSTGVHGCITNMTVISNVASAMTISGNNINVILNGVILQNNGNGYALEVNSTTNAIVTLDASSELRASNGTALRMLGNIMYVEGGNILGNQGVLLQNSASLIMHGGKISGTTLGVVADMSSKFNITGGMVFGTAKGIVALANSTIDLFGGQVDSGAIAVDANATAIINLGACVVDPGRLNINLATVNSVLQARASAVKDEANYYASTNVETVLQEIGNKLQAQDLALINQIDRVNVTEEDALVEVALLHLSSLPVEYTMTMVETFRNSNVNVYPDGADKAIVDIERSVLKHQGTSIRNYFMENFIGNVAGKSKIYLRSIISSPQIIGDGDWTVEFKLEITGGRYGTGKVVYPLQTINSANLVNSREATEYDLTTIVPEFGIVLSPILQGVEELASLVVVIHKDTVGVDATPVVRSFTAFF